MQGEKDVENVKFNKYSKFYLINFYFLLGIIIVGYNYTALHGHYI